MNEYQDELDFALGLAERAGDVIAKAFVNLDVAIRTKSDHSPVTSTDEQINQMVIDAVNEAYPDDSVLAEEGSEVKHEGGRYWVCDPIDGTSGFINGVPTAVFSIGFVVDGEIKVAVVKDPFLARTFHAIEGRGAFMDDQPLRVSDRQDLRGARFGLTSSVYEMIKLADYLTNYLKQGVNFSPCSGVVHQLMNVARGRLDVRIYNGPKAHDVAAAALIVTEAGGKATDRAGAKLKLDGDIDGAIISNGKIHDQLIGDIDKFDVRSKTIRH